MSPAHANKAGCRYRYYVSQALLQQRKEDAGSLPRLPAHDFETAGERQNCRGTRGGCANEGRAFKLGWNNEH